MEPLAAQPITGIPERHHRLNHREAVTAAVLAVEADLLLIQRQLSPRGSSSGNALLRH